MNDALHGKGCMEYFGVNPTLVPGSLQGTYLMKYEGDF